VWFAEPLLSSATPEVRRLIILARQWAAHLDKPVRAWMSDKQDAFVTAIAEEFWACRIATATITFCVMWPNL